MDLNKSSKNGVERVYIKGFDREYIPVESVTKDLVIKLSKEEKVNISQDILDYKPSEYLIGNGDVLTVSVWGPEELAITTGAISGAHYLKESLKRIVRKDGTILTISTHDYCRIKNE